VLILIEITLQMSRNSTDSTIISIKYKYNNVENGSNIIQSVIFYAIMGPIYMRIQQLIND